MSAKPLFNHERFPQGVLRYDLNKEDKSKYDKMSSVEQHLFRNIGLLLCRTEEVRNAEEVLLRKEIILELEHTLLSISASLLDS